VSEVPVQYFQSIIALELAVTGALLFQVRYFEPVRSADHDDDLPNPAVRLVIAVILAATVFGPLDGILYQGGKAEAIAVTCGLALSLLPILLRVLPPLFRSTGTAQGQTYSAITILGLVLYALAVAAIVILFTR
jgi:hypothetical protein